MVDNIQDLMSFRLSQLAAASDRAAQQWVQAEFNMRLNEWRVLGLAVSKKPVRFSKIAALLSMDKGQLSRVVNVLVKRGLMRSEPDPGDQRAVTLVATQSGESLVKEMLSVAEEQNRDVLSVLTEQEQKEMLRLLGKIAERIYTRHRDR